MQVKELQIADVKACCLHDEFNNEKQLLIMEGKYSILYGLPDARKDDKLSQANIH